MRRTGLWFLFVGGYALILGLPLLLFPDAVPSIRYASGDAVWVRVTGMCCVGYAYFTYILFRERHLPSMRANVLNQAIAALSIGATTLSLGSSLVGWIAFGVVVGFVGSVLSFRKESRELEPRPVRQLPMTARWNVYVAGYTFVYGFATAVIPHAMMPLVGFPDPVYPWVRMSGLFFFVLCVFNVVVAREKGPEAIILAILVIRIWFVANLLVLGILGYPWFVFASAGVVGFGVVGTLLTYPRERRQLAAHV
jgi:hypothetical protein